MEDQQDTKLPQEEVTGITKRSFQQTGETNDNFDTQKQFEILMSLIIRITTSGLKQNPQKIE